MITTARTVNRLFTRLSLTKLENMGDRIKYKTSETLIGKTGAQILSDEPAFVTKIVTA